MFSGRDLKSGGGIAEQPDLTVLSSAAPSSGPNYAMYIFGVAVAFVVAVAGAVDWRRRRRTS